MSAMTKRWATLYTCMLIGLAVVGVNNRHLFRTHQSLIDQKEELYQVRTQLRAQAQTVRSLDNVRVYAQRKGMVPSALLEAEQLSESVSAPSISRDISTTLELRTRWR